MSYQEVLLTLLFVLVLCWALYETVFLRLCYKPNINKALAKQFNVTAEHFDFSHQMQTAFKKGNFEEALVCAQKVLEEMPYDGSANLYKAYALYHLKRFAEAKEVFDLLETLPGYDISRMLERIDRAC